jgi:hypothetical protein
VDKLSKELIELNPDVLLARGTLAATALRQYTFSIPIIFVYVPDPVAAGFITNWLQRVCVEAKKALCQSKDRRSGCNQRKRPAMLPRAGPELGRL